MKCTAAACWILLQLAGNVQADLLGWLPGLASLLDSSESKTRYLARHETYDFDVRDRAFYSKIIGNVGESASGPVAAAERLPVCGLLSDQAASEATMRALQSGYW